MLQGGTEGHSPELQGDRECWRVVSFLSSISYSGVATTLHCPSKTCRSLLKQGPRYLAYKNFHIYTPSIFRKQELLPMWNTDYQGLELDEFRGGQLWEQGQGILPSFPS